MLVNLRGYFHTQKNKNNQDYYYCNDKVKMILDGCSLGEDFDSSNTEVGSKLFATLFSNIDPKLRDDPGMFESNVKDIFEKMIALFGSHFGEERKEKVEQLIKFFSFTILACFELDDGFVVKTMGDGYIITINKLGNISYFKFDYDNSPPYYIYNCLKEEIVCKNIQFEVYRFSKEHFNNVGVATDGIGVFASEFSIPSVDIAKADKYLLNQDKLPEPNASSRISALIGKNKSNFYDDTTLIL